jgi:sugar/nucleoside kinase (ribokinase family)
MTSYMQMIYIDTDGNARHTGVAAAMETNAATRKAFNSHRPFGVPFAQAAFLCDYYDRRGDLVDTIAIRREDFTRITGEPVKSNAQYRRIDAEFWREARMKHSRKGSFTRSQKGSFVRPLSGKIGAQAGMPGRDPKRT